MEEIKMYGIGANRDHLLSIDRAIEKATLETGRVKQEVSALESDTMKKAQSSDNRFMGLLEGADAKLERT